MITTKKSKRRVELQQRLSRFFISFFEREGEAQDKIVITGGAWDPATERWEDLIWYVRNDLTADEIIEEAMNALRQHQKAISRTWADCNPYA